MNPNLLTPPHISVPSESPDKVTIRPRSIPRMRMTDYDERKPKTWELITAIGVVIGLTFAIMKMI